MRDPIRLTEMLDIAEGEVRSMVGLITLHQQKRSRPDSWIEQHRRILQHRRQVVSLIRAEIDRRADKERNAA